VQYGDYLARALHGDLAVVHPARERDASDRVAISGDCAARGLRDGALANPRNCDGLVAAAYRDTAIDNSLLVASLAMVSMPVFWLGTMLLIAASALTRSIPLGGLAGWKS